MARTHKKVGYSPTGKLEDVTPEIAAGGVEDAFRIALTKTNAIVCGDDDSPRMLPFLTMTGIRYLQRA